MREINAGDRLDQYDLTDLLARSGMASIFKATDRVSGATVAVKVPHMQYESDVAFFQRFQREEQIGLKLQHPNIVRVLAPEKKSRIYLVMEFAEGKSLRALQGEKGKFPIDEALGIAPANLRRARVPARAGRRAPRSEARQRASDARMGRSSCSTSASRWTRRRAA